MLTRKEGWFQQACEPERRQPQQFSLPELEAMSSAERKVEAHLRIDWHANLPTIATPDVQAIHLELELLLETNVQDGARLRPPAAITAPYAGIGKTMLITDFVKGFWRDELEAYGELTPEGNQRVPAVYLTLDSDTTMRSLAQMLCHFYGLPGSDYGNRESLTNRALDAVLSCGTKLIVVDDSHLLEMHRQAGRAMAAYFKRLNSSFPITWIFVGIGINERGILTEGLGLEGADISQTARRWTVFEMGRFDITGEEGLTTFRNLLLAIEKQLVLANKVRGMLADGLVEYLFARTTGHFQSLMSLINRGCAVAIKTGTEQLTADLLDRVKIDAAAEACRQEMVAKVELSERPRQKSNASRRKARRPDPVRILEQASAANRSPR